MAMRAPTPPQPTTLHPTAGQLFMGNLSLPDSGRLRIFCTVDFGPWNRCIHSSPPPHIHVRLTLPRGWGWLGGNPWRIGLCDAPGERDFRAARSIRERKASPPKHRRKIHAVEKPQLGKGKLPHQRTTSCYSKKKLPKKMIYP